MSVLTDLASGAAGGILGGVGKLAKDIREAWTGEIPADKRAEFETRMLEIEAQMMSAQTLVNLEEAKSDKFWVSGWRPYIGWICGTNLLYSAIMYPTMNWFAKYYGSTVSFPVLDSSVTVTTLTAMLGVGVMRSYDKKQAPAPAGKE